MQFLLQYDTLTRYDLDILARIIAKEIMAGRLPPLRGRHSKEGDVKKLKTYWRPVFLILGHTTLEMVRRYVHFSSAQDMTKGHISSPLNSIGIKRLRGYKIDRRLNSMEH